MSGGRRLQALVLLAAAVVGALGAPLGGGEPVRVELPVYRPPVHYELAAAADAAYYLPPADLAAHEAYAAQLHAESGIFSAPVTKLESAVLQTEGFESKPLTVKENLQNIVAGIFQPKPIVDTISEVDKYGNTGDKFAVVGRAVVGGAEGISNLVNKALNVPGAILKKFTRKASEKLNNLGGRLIGLV